MRVSKDVGAEEEKKAYVSFGLYKQPGAPGDRYVGALFLAVGRPLSLCKQKMLT